jgi:Skp family chaperone for outer membrane proteins
LPFVEFRNCEEELKNALVASKSKVRNLEISLREVKARGQELKRAMKEVADNEYNISQKLAYETGARQGLEAKFEVVLSHCRVTKSPLQGMRWS